MIQGEINASGGSSQANMMVAEIDVHNGGTQVAGGTDTLDVDLDAIIEAYLRQGKTCTVRTVGNVAIVGAARNASGTAFGATFTFSSETISITPKTTDWSTNATIAASAIGSGTGTAAGAVTGGLAAGARPYRLIVGFEYA